ncbi:hypothetical protein L1885_13510, partial [Streptomyces fuscigenes]|nr:hypothetical protein [Streptomyces fuscigenes]
MDGTAATTNTAAEAAEATTEAAPAASPAAAAAARTLDAVRRLDPGIQAFVPEPDRPGRLAREAAGLDERFGAAPGDGPALYGVAVGVKDIVRVDGLDTRAGSAL